MMSAAVRSADATFELTIAAGKVDRMNEPVSVPIAFGGDLTFAKALSASLRAPNGDLLPGQITGQSLLSREGKKGRELHFVLPSLKADKTTTYIVTVSDATRASGDGFDWKPTSGRQIDLFFGSRPVLRYICPRFDDSTKEKRELTYKVFHHVYDPDGTRLVTNSGAGGLYPHHRGLFFGFNKISYGDKKADVWHCTGDCYQSHEGVIVEEAGPVLGRHRVLIRWHGPGKEVFVLEMRELTVYRVPGGHLVEFASRVKSTVGPVKLDGDPQHAGFHFRADQEVAAKTKGQTYFLRPDGAGKPGETRNWPQDKKHVNLPWDAMSFVLAGQRYTAAYLDRPANPKEARFSERDYGRFGSYFEYELTPDKPLEVNYRLWLQNGEMKPGEVAGLSAAFVTPVQVSVK